METPPPGAPRAHISLSVWLVTHWSGSAERPSVRAVGWGQAPGLPSGNLLAQHSPLPGCRAGGPSRVSQKRLCRNVGVSALDPPFRFRGSRLPPLPPPLLYSVFKKPYQLQKKKKNVAAKVTAAFRHFSVIASCGAHDRWEGSRAGSCVVFSLGSDACGRVP